MSLQFAPSSTSRLPTSRLVGPKATTKRPLRSSRCSDQPTHDAFDAGGLAKALAAAAAVVALTGRVHAARAADDEAWKPRRHHRHIDERITDTWADAVIEVRRRPSAEV
jgi:hypothetical protein